MFFFSEKFKLDWSKEATFEIASLCCALTSRVGLCPIRSGLLGVVPRISSLRQLLQTSPLILVYPSPLSSFSRSHCLVLVCYCVLQPSVSMYSLFGVFHSFCIISTSLPDLIHIQTPVEGDRNRNRSCYSHPHDKESKENVARVPLTWRRIGVSASPTDLWSTSVWNTQTIET